ncbi:MAG: CotH kinase family protein [Phaeodactylibacter sp.]|nr:CotH kinase family protein [Phaeodactylibacter sp.]
MRGRPILLLIFYTCWWTGTLRAQAPQDQHKPELAIHFSYDGGFYEGEVDLQLACPGADIYYTLDGNEPTIGKAEQRYTTPIHLNQTTVVRAIAIKASAYTPVATHTFFIREPHTNFAVVSLAVPPVVLFNPSTGLFVKGENAVDSLWMLPGANFWSRKEVFASTEIFEADGNCVFRSGTGFRLFGGMSRLFPQKSMAIVARERYGESRIRYPIFGKKGLKKFKFLVLRNSGSDFGRAHFRDSLMTSLVEDWDLDKQDSRPAHVYINGQYWGIYNIREKINRYYLAGHHNVDKDSVDLLEHRYTLKQGSRRPYMRLLDYLENNDLSSDANFAYVQTMMDVNNFLNYELAQIYFDNQDAGGNIRYWRPKTEDGRFRWILYDTDWGFGLHESDAYTHNSLEFHTAPDGPGWPNPPWSTFILRKLLENKQFERQFITRFCDHLNTAFHPYRVLGRIDAFEKMYEPEMDRHLERWNLRRSEWEADIAIMRKFAEERAELVRMHLMERFDTGQQRKLRIEVVGGGKVLVNDFVEVEEIERFSGTYFEHLPVHLTAVPKLGYRFSHWEGIGIDKDVRNVALQLRGEVSTVKAVFEQFEDPLEGKIIINEISSNNKVTGDWLELYNKSDDRILMTGVRITDFRHSFILPEIILPPKDYLVVCVDKEKFISHFSASQRVVGNLGFGLNKREEKIGLFSQDGALIDEVLYDVPPSDSAFTLNLMLPNLDNADPENWEILYGFGSPNEANDYYVAATIQARREMWMEIGGASAVILVCITLLLLRHRGKI